MPMAATRPPLMPEVGVVGGGAGAVDDLTAADDEVVGHGQTS